MNGIVKFEGKPVGGAFIQLTNDNGVKYSTKTDEKGKYKLEIPIAKYRVYAQRPSKNSIAGLEAEFFKNDFLIIKKRKIKFDISLGFYGEG